MQREMTLEAEARALKGCRSIVEVWYYPDNAKKFTLFRIYDGDKLLEDAKHFYLRMLRQGRLHGLKVLGDMTQEEFLNICSK